jgi:hypothetical protein
MVFGDARMLPGGRQINHLPTTKIEVKNKEIEGKDRFGNSTREANEHTFKLTKRKHGSSIDTGEFRMVVNQDNEQGLPMCSFDDHMTVVAYAKRMNVLTGSGGHYRLEDYDTEREFRKLEDIGNFLREEPEAYLWAKQTIIALQRETKGYGALPPDGYLLDWAENEA